MAAKANEPRALYTLERIYEMNNSIHGDDYINLL